MHSSILRRIWLNFMAQYLGGVFFFSALVQFSQFFFRISNFFGLSTTEKTLVVEMRIWCIIIGIVLVLHFDTLILTTVHNVYLIKRTVSWQMWSVDRGCLLLLGTWSHLSYIQRSVFTPILWFVFPTGLKRSMFVIYAISWYKHLNFSTSNYGQPWEWENQCRWHPSKSRKFKPRDYFMYNIPSAFFPKEESYSYQGPCYFIYIFTCM
jgi:hypothetical protein